MSTYCDVCGDEVTGETVSQCRDCGQLFCGRCGNFIDGVGYLCEECMSDYDED